MIVLGIDKNHNSKAVEILGKSKEEIQKMLEEEGWNNITFLRK